MLQSFVPLFKIVVEMGTSQAYSKDFFWVTHSFLSRNFKDSHKLSRVFCIIYFDLVVEMSLWNVCRIWFNFRSSQFNSVFTEGSLVWRRFGQQQSHRKREMWAKFYMELLKFCKLNSLYRSFQSIAITLDKRRELRDGVDQRSATAVWHFLKTTQTPVWIIRNLQFENNLYFNFIGVLGNLFQVWM